MPKYKTKIQRFVTREEALAMLDKCKNFNEQVFVSLCYVSGARTSEILELTKEKFIISDEFLKIKLKTKKLRIDPQKFQAMEDRTLSFERHPVDPFIENIIVAVYELGVGDRILPFSSRWAQLLLNRLGTEVIGLPLTPYHFRHTAVTNQASQNKTLDQLMHFKGAKDVRSVIPYLHARPYDVKVKP
jgi:integrase